MQTYGFFKLVILGLYDCQSHYLKNYLMFSIATLKFIYNLIFHYDKVLLFSSFCTTNESMTHFNKKHLYTSRFQ